MTQCSGAWHWMTAWCERTQDVSACLRNNSAYVGFILTGACVGTYVVDGVFDGIWNVANKGVTTRR
jgi:hypothetical protein